MRSVSPSFNLHLQGDVTTLATCWKIIRTDGVIKTYTDCDKDIVFGGNTYLSIVGFTPSSIESKDDFSVDNLDVQGVLQTGYITAPDLMAGIYDYAEVEIFLVNYQDISQGRMWLKRGKLGEVRLKAMLDEHLQSILLSEIAPGDIALFRFQQQPQHVGFITDRADGTLGILHCYSNSEFVIEHRLNEGWMSMLVQAYRFKPEQLITYEAQ